VAVAVAVCFLRAAGRVGSRVEIEDHGLVGERGQLDLLAGIVQEREIGGPGSFLEFRHTLKNAACRRRVVKLQQPDAAGISLARTAGAGSEPQSPS
jgi:hypothetical protein